MAELEDMSGLLTSSKATSWCVCTNGVAQGFGTCLIFGSKHHYAPHCVL